MDPRGQTVLGEVTACRELLANDPETHSPLCGKRSWEIFLCKFLKMNTPSPNLFLVDC